MGNIQEIRHYIYLPDGLADEEVICISNAICWRSDMGALVAEAPRLLPDPLPGVPRGLEVDGIPFTFCTILLDANGKRSNSYNNNNYRDATIITTLSLPFPSHRSFHLFTPQLSSRL